MNVSHVGDGSRKACAGIARSSSPVRLAIVVRVQNARRQWTQMTGIISSSRGVNTIKRKVESISNMKGRTNESNNNLQYRMVSRCMVRVPDRISTN